MGALFPFGVWVIESEIGTFRIDLSVNPCTSSYFRDGADECYAEKQELLNAESKKAIKRSVRKIKLLCNY